MDRELPSFSIHQDMWHDAWLAATAASRSRKRQIDLDVRQRVEKLLQEYGPSTPRPLTLRVYGTMMKGFCVINNERARVLFADCERIVIMFSQKGLEDSNALKLPASKKPRVDALTLDLDLAKVRESEAFDWTQAPLEEGALLRLPDEQQLLGDGPQALDTSEPSLLQQVALLDEAFPPLDAPMSGPVDVVAEAARTAGTLALPGGAVGCPMDWMVPAVEDEALFPFEPVTAEDQPKKLRRRGHKLPPGKWLGFDNETVLSAQEYDAWQRDDACITRPPGELRGQAALVCSQAAGTSERLGKLRTLIDPSLEDMRLAVVGSNSSTLSLLRKIPGGRGAAAALPEVQQLLAGEGMQPEALAAMLAEPPEALPAHGGGIFGQSLMASRPDPFHPYSPEAPLRSTRGAIAEIAEVLRPQPHEEPSPDEGDLAGMDLPYDSQTAKIGMVLRRSLEAASTEGEAVTRGVTFDDVVPLKGTDRATAAKTFAAVLVLATAGELRVMQPMPYGPIAMSWAA